MTELLREVDFMPLAVTLLARLDDLPSRLLREWSEHNTAVLEADRHDGTRRELSIEVSIKISLAHLPVESVIFQPRQLLSVMGQLPAGLFPAVSVKLHSAIPHLDAATQDLLRHSLVYAGGNGELRMFSPVRHYVSTCLRMSDAMLSIVDEVYLQIAHGHPLMDRMYVDGAVYDFELPNILSILTSTLDRGGTLELVETILSLARYCLSRSFSCLRLLQKLLPRLDHTSYHSAECHRAISQHYRVAGELSLAIPFLEWAADRFAALGLTADEATSREGLAATFKTLDRHEDAHTQMRRAELLLRESSELSHLADPLPGEDLMLAEQRFRDVREVSINDGDTFAIITLSERILKILLERGDMVAYIAELELVVTFDKQTSSMSVWCAGTKLTLSHRYCENGNIEGAEGLIIEAYAACSGHNRSAGVAAAITALATIRYLQRRFDEGVELNKAAAKLWRECGHMADATNCEQMAETIRERAAMFR